MSAQQVYMALLESGGGSSTGGVIAEAVAKMLSQGVQDQIETCRQTSIRYIQYRVNIYMIRLSYVLLQLTD